MITEPYWITVAKGELYQPTDANRVGQYFQATTLRPSTDNVPWCSAFVNWVMAESGLDGSGKANALSWLDWGMPMDRPTPGAIIVLQRGLLASGQGHVGFLMKEHDDTYSILGGNQHDCVCIEEFGKGRVLGFRWPKS